MGTGDWALGTGHRALPMLILAADTSLPILSVALLRDGLVEGAVVAPLGHAVDQQPDERGGGEDGGERDGSAPHSP